MGALTRRIVRSGLLSGVLLAILCLISRPSAQAQAQDVGLRTLGRFLSVGGYFFTDSTGRGALGTPKFYTQTRFYSRPVGVGGFVVSGGAEIISASDHFLPFSGGNEFRLIGVSGRISLPRSTNNIRPYISGGLFAETIKSDRLSFNKTEFAPSIALGVETKLGKIFTISADYRFSKKINGVSADGLSVYLRVY